MYQHPSLNIKQGSLSSSDKFRPISYWISPSITSSTDLVSGLIQRIDPNIKRTCYYGGVNTLHVGSTEDVISVFGHHIYYVSLKFLKEAAEIGLKDFHISYKSPQCLSLILNSDNFVVDGYKGNEKALIESKIRLLGGNLNLELVNVFVSNNPILPTMISAFEDQIEIVSKKWVENCFEKMERVEFKPFRLQRFNGLVFTASDLMPQKVKLLKKLVNERCGKWNDNLNDETSILIASKLGNTQKIKQALKYSIPIVKPEWIFKQSQAWTQIESYVLNFWCLKKIRTSLFNGISFQIHEKCDEKALHLAIEANSGSISDNPDFIIVDNLYIEDDDKNYVTTSWIWDCISKQKLIPKTSSIAYQPLHYLNPSNDFKGFAIAFYDINDDLRYELSECLRAIGISVHLRVSKTSNIIVSEKIDEELRDLNLKYGFEIVSTNWVYDLIKTNTLPPTYDYVLTKENKEQFLMPDGSYVDIDDFREKLSSPIIKNDRVEIRTQINISFNINNDSLLNELLNS